MLATSSKLLSKVAKSIPKPIVNRILLSYPSLYTTKFVDYESYLPDFGREELLNKLDSVLNIEGNIIECGSARCGTTVILSNYLRSKGINKIVYACDTFGGFDLNEFSNEKELGLTSASKTAFAKNSYDYVKNKIRKLGLSDSIIPMQGLFQNTLPKINSKFCFAFIDCDHKNSIIYSAETIWENLSHNGMMLFDDYTTKKYEGAKVAIDYIVHKYKNEISEHGLMKRLYFIKKL